MKNRKEYGFWGERKAERYLKRHHYRILARNYTTPVGEIDLIAADGDVLVFIEVKTRSSTAFGLPCEAVTLQKQHKIVQVAQCYLMQNPTQSPCRFDVVEILPEGLRLLKDAFRIE